MERASFDRLAGEHSAAGDELGALLGEVVAAASAAYEAKRVQIEAAAARWQKTKDDLASAVEAAPAEFEKPRTRRHAGIEFGLAKGRDVAYPSDATADLIRELHPDLAADLLKETVVKARALKLPADVRRAIKIRVTRGRDVSFVRRVRDDLDATVASITSIVT